MKDSLSTVFFFFCRNPAASLLSESMVSFDPLCGIAARKETMKLAGLRLRVIWTLPVFSYLNLGKIERKNCAQAQEACDARLFVLPKYFTIAIQNEDSISCLFFFWQLKFFNQI